MTKKAVPNDEQKLAIEHCGGVLLSAGAGAGKTFVLREHFIYLVKQHLAETVNLTQIEIEKRLKSFLKSLVFMTFTKKAAGELHIRIKNRVLDEAVEDERFLLVAKHFGCFFVGTIHGFCHKLISEGAIQTGNITLEMVADVQIEQKISRIFEQGFEQLIKSNDENYLTTQSLVRNFNHLKDSFKKIFSSTEIRMLWMELARKENADIDMQEQLELLLDVFDLNVALKIPYREDLSTQYDDKAFIAYLSEWMNLAYKQGNRLTFENISAFEAYAGKRAAHPRKENTKADFGASYEEIKKFCKFIREYGDHLKASYIHKDGELKKWLHSLLFIYRFIEQRYYLVEGISFADLEFCTLNALRRGVFKKTILQQYQYFVIDEFQDTSSTQMEIVSIILEHDYSRLFCVGDPKQAIYGFRGGSVGVFLDLAQQIGKNLYLKNNYRSSKEVIHFNNDFFRYLFRLGPGYEGDDRHTIAYVPQTIPAESPSFDAALHRYVMMNATEEDNFEQLEAAILSNLLLKNVINNNSKEVHCILYRRLAPARALIERLIQYEIGFTAQTKIPFGDDPVLAIFSVVIQLLNDINSRRAATKDPFKYPSLIIEAMLAIYRIEYPISEISNQLRTFCSDLKVMGIYVAYMTFLRRIGLCNSRFNDNFVTIGQMVNSSRGDIYRIFALLEDEKQDNIKVEIRFGKNPHLVQLMTVHASKGLQFDHIYLGGMFGSSRSPANSAKVGSLPSSFKWSVENNSDEEFKTPAFILEQEQEKQKEFSESKRLFYVAFTRAIRSITYIDCPVAKVEKNSWLNGLRRFLEEVSYSNELVNKADIDVSEFRISNTGEVLSIPLVYHNKVGLEPVPQSSTMVMALLPELSVTKASSMLNCSRKFYLEHVLKLSESDIEEYEEENNVLFDDNIVQPGSSAQRGSEIHKMIELMFEHNFVLPLNALNNPEYVKILEWVKAMALPYLDSHGFIAENEIRFDFYGTMITGIPDLILRPKSSARGNNWEIWDFKTGRMSAEKTQQYYFQLMAYALGLKQIYQLGDDDVFSLKIVYVDQQSVLSEQFPLKKISNDLFNQVSTALDYSSINLKHCPKCQFRTVCH